MLVEACLLILTNLNNHILSVCTLSFLEHEYCEEKPGLSCIVLCGLLFILVPSNDSEATTAAGHKV